MDLLWFVFFGTFYLFKVILLFFLVFLCLCCLFCCVCWSETDIFDKERCSTWLATETLLMCLFRHSCSKPSSLIDFRSFGSRRHNCWFFWVFKMFNLSKTLFRYLLQCLSNHWKKLYKPSSKQFQTVIIKHWFNFGKGCKTWCIMVFGGSWRRNWWQFLIWWSFFLFAIMLFVLVCSCLANNCLKLYKSQS